MTFRIIHYFFRYFTFEILFYLDWTQMSTVSMQYFKSGFCSKNRAAQSHQRQMQFSLFEAQLTGFFHIEKESKRVTVWGRGEKAMNVWNVHNLAYFCKRKNNVDLFFIVIKILYIWQINSEHLNQFFFAYQRRERGNYPIIQGRYMSHWRTQYLYWSIDFRGFFHRESKYKPGEFQQYKTTEIVDFLQYLRQIYISSCDIATTEIL